jgi:hypothetical protein
MTAFAKLRRLQPIEPILQVSLARRTTVHAALPLAILEAIQGLDEPIQDGLAEYHDDLSAKRFGLSRTVAAQIDRFQKLALSDSGVSVDELVALMRLVARRQDAGLVFSEAGRRAGRFAVKRVGAAFRGGTHALPGSFRNRVGFALARRTVRRVFDVRLNRNHGVPEAALNHPPSADADPDGSPCTFYGSALAQTLRLLTDFDGAMLHVACHAKGDDSCVWRASSPNSIEEQSS